MVDVATTEELARVEGKIDALAKVVEGHHKPLPPIVDQEPIDPPPVEPIDPPEDGWDYEVQHIPNLGHKRLTLVEYGGQPYTRHHELLVISGKAFTLRVMSGTALSGTYQFLLDGMPWFEKKLTKSANEWWVGVPIDSTKVPDGWHWITINGGNISGLTPVPMAAFFLNGNIEDVDQETMPVWTGTYDSLKTHPGKWWGATVPAKFDPTPRPIEARLPYSRETLIGEDSFLGDMPDREMLPGKVHQTMVVPYREGDTHYPQKDSRGIISTTARQPYYPEYLKLMPHVPIVSGPRGVGTIGQMTQMTINSVGGIDGTTGQSVARAFQEGGVQVRAGLDFALNDGYAPNWQEKYPTVPRELLRGDWDVEDKYLGFKELWSQDWWQRTITLNHDAEKVDNLPPHHGTGPVQFVCDPGRHAVYKLQYFMDMNSVLASHAMEPKVTVLLSHGPEGWPLKRPYQAKERDDLLYITEQGRDRVLVYDLMAEKYLPNLIETPLVNGESRYTMFHGAENASIRATRSLTELRAQPSVGVESIDFCDDYAYLSSFVQKEVRRFHLPSKKLETAIDASGAMNNNSGFLNISVAKDGTAVPKHSVLFATWSNLTNDYFKKTEEGWERASLFERYQGGRPVTGDKPYADIGYLSACAVGKGAVWRSSSAMGLFQLTHQREDDPVIDWDLFDKGYKEYNSEQGLRIRHGHGGFEYYGKAPPTGSDAMNYYLSNPGDVV